MGRVLVNAMQSHWPVHFIAPDAKTRIGPWLLLDSQQEVLTTLRWGGVSAAELAEHESALRRWGCSSVAEIVSQGFQTWHLRQTLSVCTYVRTGRKTLSLRREMLWL